MNKIVIATIISLSSFSAMADSCKQIVNYSMSYMIKSGASKSILSIEDVYLSTCNTAIAARGVMSKDNYIRKIINGSSGTLEAKGNADMADTNTLVAKIAYDHAD
ncbi:hypothetical protein EJP81_14640 [Rahnella aquatilis]|nr:hypothetical protein EJP79_14635 [Rahnella aquatilis]AZP47359.1 hypothetical protein EJP81_14640 [Rahnella aquatilis]